jgi:CubicO group peptidase (beta-lactamase class C family)
MKNLPRTPTLRLVALIFALSSLEAQVEPLAGLDDYISQAMTTFQVPGVAVAVVKDGKVVLAKGYGVRKLGEPAKVDERTRALRGAIVPS